jgi:hypothetical protein
MRRMALVAALATAAAASPSALALGDADKGARLVQACTQCHNAGAYERPRAKLRSFRALQAEVAKWTDYYNPKFDRLEVADLVAYLNREYYKFPEDDRK